jgi:hypothetical protein
MGSEKEAKKVTHNIPSSWKKAGREMALPFSSIPIANIQYLLAG